VNNPKVTHKHSCSRRTVYVASFVLTMAISTSNGEVVSTNWNGLSFQLVMPGTNWFIGDPIPASLVMSNTVESEQVVRWRTGDLCGCGFGLFEIIEMSSGTQMKCNIPDYERPVIGAGMMGLKPQ